MPEPAWLQGLQGGKIKSPTKRNSRPNEGEGWSKPTIRMQNDQVLVKASLG